MLSDPKEADLKGHGLPELKDSIHKALHDHKKVNLIARSPHGSAKTTGIVPLLTEIAEEYLGRPARVLYICTLKITRGVARELIFDYFYTKLVLYRNTK